MKKPLRKTFEIRRANPNAYKNLGSPDVYVGSRAGNVVGVPATLTAIIQVRATTQKTQSEKSTR